MVKPGGLQEIGARSVSGLWTIFTDICAFVFWVVGRARLGTAFFPLLRLETLRT